MSKVEPKYPGLAKAVHAAGDVVTYMTAYQRLDYGWPLSRAISEPSRKRAPRPPKVHRKIISARDLFAWERPEWNARVRKERKRYIPPSNDTSPYHIRVLRAAYCNQFIKTGELNVDMLGLLQEYANAQSSSTAHATDATNRNEGIPGREGRSETHSAGEGSYVSELRAPDR